MAVPPIPQLGKLRWSLEDHEVACLGQNGVIVRDGFLGTDRAMACAAAARALDDAGRLSPAGVGRHGEHRPDVRGDRTAWFAELELPDPLRDLWTELSALRETLNEAAWLGLRRFELQLACYPGGGARYAAHRDAFAGDPSRRVTAICYLNDGWRPEHGGELVVHGPEGPRAIAPVLDRLLVFLSDRVLHEVQPVYAPRFAATAWYRGAEPLPRLPDAREEAP